MQVTQCLLQQAAAKAAQSSCQALRCLGLGFVLAYAAFRAAWCVFVLRMLRMP